MQAVSQIANEVLLSGAERKCPGMQQGHGHGSAVRDGTADAVHPPGILLRNADADGDVIAFADRVEDRAAVADVQQVCVALESQHVQRIVRIDVRVGDEGIPL